jgi:hypothetical protein
MSHWEDMKTRYYREWIVFYIAGCVIAVIDGGRRQIDSDGFIDGSRSESTESREQFILLVCS